jgi:hypothetical protein
VATLDTLVTEPSAVLSMNVDRVGGANSVTVTAQFTGSVENASVGAFTMMLDFDTARLRFEEEGSSVAGGAGAMRAAGGTVRIAGVAVNGFPLGPVFSARFTMLAPSTPSVGTLTLTATEISSINFANQLPADESRRSILAR